MKITVLFLLFTFAFCESAISQEMPSAPLKYTIFLVEANNNEIIVNTEITNTSDKEIVIDKKRLLSKIIYNKLEENSPNQIAKEGTILVRNSESISDKYQGDYLMLPPKESFKKIRKFKIDEGFFESGRKYNLILLYTQNILSSYNNVSVWKGLLKSNEMFFEL